MSIGSTNISVELDMYIQFRMSTTDEITLRPADILNVSIGGSELIIEYEEKISDSWAEIYCHVSDLENEIEIRGCLVSIQKQTNTAIISYSIRYTFRLNKNTKYVLGGHYIRFLIDKDLGHLLKFNIYNLVITFGGHTKTYEWTKEISDDIFADLESTNLISDFENYGGQYTQA
ncbi:hypothetical protein RF11_12041 [Thelohanellus kitauei]|uniref:Uncharacterized protein n=1 Tax=Thelohanellus kitauei TaxID=669202 RepID=A0A0C2MNG4_THEKT|nr:hypothetical protein RF11_12041 [Thelohanellus kitauei]